MRNVCTAVPKHAQGVVCAAVRTIFAQPDDETAKRQLGQMVDKLQMLYPTVANMLVEAEEDVLAYMTFPQAHWETIRTTNLLERLNREIKRRSDVVGIFPNREALLRLVGSLLIEQNEEWAIGRRYMSAETMALIDQPMPALPAMQVLAGPLVA
jgi:transposase-like protein